MKNLPASIHARLLNHAKKVGRDFNAVVLQYFQERFLYRLSICPYRKKLILKGAFLFLSYNAPRTRPTKDMDFLGYLNINDFDCLREIIFDICSIKCDDGVFFDVENISIESIHEEGEYHGLRVKFTAYMGKINRAIQLDIGSGDIIIPRSVEIDFPSLLDFPSARIFAYSTESIIAEKFEAIVHFNFLTSRMKDFFDILFLAQHQRFAKQTLRKAILSTFNNRKTSLPDRAIIFGSNYKIDSGKQVQWTSFLKRNKLTATSSFITMIEQLEQFLEPVCSSNDDQAFWHPEKWEWI